MIQDQNLGENYTLRKKSEEKRLITANFFLAGTAAFEK